MPPRRGRSPNRSSTSSSKRCGSAALIVETGVFGADMHVALVNDGPVTVMLEI